jgi:hypothetical protein
MSTNENYKRKNTPIFILYYYFLNIKYHEDKIKSKGGSGNEHLTDAIVSYLETDPIVPA